MEFFKTNTKIPFMRQRKWTAIFSSIIFLASIISLSIHGLNLGLDFTGGTQIEVTYDKPVETNVLRESLTQAGFTEAQVQAYSLQDFSVRIAPKKNVKQDVVEKEILAALPGAKVSSFSYIGPTVGKTLMTNGLLAILVCLIGTMLYIALRFEIRFAISAALALIHDPMLILGVFSFFHIEFNLISLTALLTVIGYSLNDTIVVYDRVRENFRKVRKSTPEAIMDLSINETLSRTIMTSGLTLVAVVSLCIFGGETLRPFSIAMIIGIVIGTYSSIYVAGALALAFGLDRTTLSASKLRPEDETP